MKVEDSTAIWSRILSATSNAANVFVAEVDGEVLFDAASRGRYSTDASIYQVEPIGVVVPRSEEAARGAIAIAAMAAVLIASAILFPPGKATRVTGGYRLSGRWPFSSGVDSSWSSGRFIRR